MVDVHQSWTGPCVAAQSTLKKIVFDHGDKPLKMFTADASRLTALHDYAGPCEPLFVVIKDDDRVEIKGLDAPKLRAAILQKLGVESRTQAVIAAARIAGAQWKQGSPTG